MDESNTYYTAGILDSCFKYKCLKKELEKGEYELIFGDIRNRLHTQYGHSSAIYMKFTTQNMKKKADSRVKMTQAMKQNS